MFVKCVLIPVFIEIRNIIINIDIFSDLLIIVIGRDDIHYGTLLCEKCCNQFNLRLISTIVLTLSTYTLILHLIKNSIAKNFINIKK